MSATLPKLDLSLHQVAPAADGLGLGATSRWQLDLSNAAGATDQARDLKLDIALGDDLGLVAGSVQVVDGQGLALGTLVAGAHGFTLALTGTLPPGDSLLSLRFQAVVAPSATPGETLSPAASVTYSGASAHQLVYATNNVEPSIYQYDLTTGTLANLAGPTGGMDSLAFTPSGSIVYTQQTGQAGLTELDLVSGTSTTLVAGLGTGDLVLAPDGHTVFYNANTPGHGELRAYDLATHGDRLVADQAGGTFLNGMAFNPGTGQLYAAFSNNGTGNLWSASAGSLVELNPADGSVLRASAMLGAVDGVAWDPWSGHLFVSGGGTPALFELDPASLTVVHSWAIASINGLDGIAADGQGHLFVARYHMSITEVDLTAPLPGVNQGSHGVSHLVVTPFIDDVVPLAGVPVFASHASATASVSLPALAGHLGGTAFALEPAGICGWKLPGAVFTGVTVQLLNATGGVVASTLTDSAGHYGFDAAPGQYTLRFVAPDGLALAPRHSGWLHDGSDANPATGLAASVQLASGASLDDIDAGFLHLTGSVVDGTATQLAAGGCWNGNGGTGPVLLQASGDATVNQPGAGSVILGGAGRLVLSGPNDGAVYAIGGSGWAELHGGNGGAAMLMTGQGGGNLEGTAGNDILLAGCGATSMQGLGSTAAGSGLDLMVGGRGNDTLEANQSTAVVLGGAGNDAIHGGGAHSLLMGGGNTGTASFSGGVITSLVVGDTVNGTGANTTFVYQAGDGVQWIENFNPAQGDTLQVWGHGAPTAVATWNGCGVLYFGPDAALVIHGWQPQNGALAGVEYHAEAAALPGAFASFNPLAPSLLGRTATSYCGTQGDDIAIGSDSATAFRGNGGHDYLVGGAGNDVFHAGADANTLRGEAGDDSFYGATGSDSIDGGSGTDKVVYSFAHGSANLVHLGNGDWEVVKPQGVDLLHEVEKVQFSDGVLTLATSSFSASLANDPDFNGDGRGDLLFRNDDGGLYQWQMDGGAIASQGTAGWVGNEWHIAATADFSGDGRADILWQHANGAYYLWEMAGTAQTGGGDLVNPGGSWQVVAVADFNGDAMADLLWRNADGALYSWEMDGNAMQAGHDFGSIGNDWQVKLSADLNGDGRADVLWQNDAGAVYLWEMDGGTLLAQGSVGEVGADWLLVGSGDFNADGKADLLWQNGATGALYEWQMDGFGITGQGTLAAPGLGWHVSEIEDLNGDHKADLVLGNASGDLYALMVDALATTAGHDLGHVGNGWHLV